ncbi:Xylem cysteine proteinase 1 [Hordeum vulgare]|nr:Xylem cysteine proteinase 1 [Hordeum vulgare]
MPSDALHNVLLQLRDAVACRPVSRLFREALTAPFLALLPALRLLLLRHPRPEGGGCLHAFDPDRRCWLRLPFTSFPPTRPSTPSPPPAPSSTSGSRQAHPRAPPSSSSTSSPAASAAHLPKALAVCNPLAGTYRLLPSLGSAWARHDTVLAGPGGVVLVLTELAVLSYSPSEGSAKWMKHPLSLPSKPRSPTPAFGAHAVFALCDVDTPWRSQWKLFSCPLVRLTGGWAPAFSTVAAVEGINQIVTGRLESLSEQKLMDCDNTFDHGCGGGLMDFAYAYIVGNQGIHTDGDYPYLMEEGNCKEKQPHSKVVTISGYEDVPENSELSLLKALAHQPVSVGIAAGSRDFQFYKGGVFEGTCGAQLDHALTAVGYGSSDGEDYIIMKNSWGGG